MTVYSFPNLEPVPCSMSGSNCCFLICLQMSQEAGKVVWYSHLSKNFPQFDVIHTVKGFGIANKAEVDVCLESACFFYDPTDVGNLISSSSAFSKSSVNIWRFSVHILLKPNLGNFEKYIASMWDECNWVVVGTFFCVAFEIGMKTDLFQACGHCWVFLICGCIECSTFTASSSGFEIAQLLPEQNSNFPSENPREQGVINSFWGFCCSCLQVGWPLRY